MKHYIDETASRPADFGAMCLYHICSPYFDEDMGLNWLNYSYPSWHRHDHWEMMLITEGTLLNSVNSQKILMKRGDLCLLCPEDCHRIDFPDEEKGCKHMSFLIKTDYLQKYLDCYGKDIYSKLCDRQEIPVYSVGEDKLYSICNTAISFKSFKIDREEKVLQTKIIVNDLLNTVVRNLFHQTALLPDWMTDFLYFINNPLENITDVRSLAHKTPYSYSRLAHIFKETTGRTIVDYIAHVKINHAQELLRSTDLSVLEIAGRLRYDSISNFNITFKRITGKSPTVYRKEWNVLH